MSLHKRRARMDLAVGLCLLVALCACAEREPAETVTEGSAVTESAPASESDIEPATAGSEEAESQTADETEAIGSAVTEGLTEPSTQTTPEEPATAEPDPSPAESGTEDPVVELPKVDFD